MRTNRLRQKGIALLTFILVALSASACAAGLTIEWSTATELNTAGFNLYRGQAPDGPFDVKINPQLIPRAADPPAGQKYQYVDRTARSGITYYYQVQEVQTDGTVTTAGPISARTSGFGWRQAAVLALLALGVLALWIFGSKEAMRPRKG